MEAITAYGLTKQYGGQAVLQGVNLQVQPGSAMACAGWEGAGKTTLIRLLAGLCRPTAGECAVLGLSPAFETAKLHARMGVVLEHAPLYGHMTLSENLRFFAGLHGMDGNDGLERSSFLLHRLDIWGYRDKKAVALPTGVARRASLARALLHSPQVLLMDEAARGLDAETAETVKALLSHQVQEEGLALLLGTRNLGYAQSFCDSFALLHDGVLMARGSLDSLRQGAGARFRAALRLAEGEEGPPGFRWEDGFWQKEIGSEKEMPALIAQLVGQGRGLYEAKMVSPTLEEVYRGYVAGGRRREALADGQQDGQGPEGAAAPGSGAQGQPEGQGPAQPGGEEG